MLQAIRSRAGSLVVKILFGVLILSFGVWGIGDIFRQRTAAETTVAKVGGRSIQADQLQIAVQQQVQRMRTMFGGNFSLEQAKQLGVVDTVLDQLVNGELLDLEDQRMGVVVSDQVVRDAILANPSFNGSAGSFDRNTFNNILAGNQLSEDRYVALVRRDIAQQALASAVTGGATVPPALVDPLYRARNENRVADTVFIASDKMAAIAEPTDEQLQEFHDKHEDLFRAPEYRGFTALALRPEDVASDIEIPEDKLRQEYQQRIEEFQTPERRQIEQILVGEEAKAREAEAQLAQGKDFAAVAKDVAGQEGDAIKLGWVQRDEMPAGLAEAAFSIAQGETTKAVQSPLGWHIIKVTAVEAASMRPFEEVRPQLQAAMAHEAAADQLVSLSNQVEDALAGGATLDQVADKFKFKEIKVEGVDPDGRDAKGEPVALPFPEMLRTAFNTDKGQTTRLEETKDNSYYMLRLDSVTPSLVKPLAEARDRAKELWLADRRNAAAEIEAKAIAEAVNGGRPLADLAKEKQLEVATSKKVTRRGGAEAALPATLVARLFEMKPGEAAATAGTNGWIVAQLKSTEVPDPAADKAAVDKVAAQLADGMRGDLLVEFEKALRSQHRVEVNREALDRLL